MRDRQKLRSRKSQLATFAFFGLLAWIAENHGAKALTAKEVLTKMTADERHAYKAGIVDGLAQARWLKDKPDVAGMNCTYDWFYKIGKTTSPKLLQLMERNPDKQMSGLIYVLIKKECGW